MRCLSSWPQRESLRRGLRQGSIQHTLAIGGDASDGRPSRGISHSLAAYVGLLLAAPPVEAYTTAQHWFRHGHRIEHTLRLGPYDSYSSLFYDFKVERTPREALSLYRRLLVPSIIPRCALIQLSVYPLPTLPPYLNANFPDFYRRFEVKDGLNLVRVLASGAEEPYALSLFVGDIVPFVQKGTSDGR